ncbi:glycoside hydrolase family 127 protein [Fulvivirga ligni]|uniref:glycoside hydrolase family 127 protein n=1 Tax=Fulvivirga ligni TaxID=2904246 RepID=UPI001F19B65F|nr:glycoside hydrolase family 127 protein [Fulvivirga ligni]UII21454.1 glycoside hydrolase family 127 protein [Fulvivirga ligni]
MKLKNILLTAGAVCLLIACDKKEQPKLAVEKKVELQAEPFALHQVELLESPFTHAYEKDREWILLLKPDRLLYRFRKFAGLQPKDSIYGGWESRGVSGQTLGHYLSALAMGYDATGDKEFLDRANYIVDELADCQKAYGNGYVGAVPEHERIFKEVSNGDIRSAGFDLNGGWVPWYNLHKLFAGLIDVYLLTGNEKAKEIVTQLGDWAVNTVGSLSQDDFQKMLACEHGGMNESLTYLYGITGDKKYYDLAEKFNHKAVLDPIIHQNDQLEGLHANTQIPKLIGLGRQYEFSGDDSKRAGVEFFWNRVVNHHSYVIGGNSNFEHFGPADNLTGRLSTNSAETCNTYNMLKLTRELFTWDPQAQYADYYERALYNHILASQNPETGMITYYVNMASGEGKKFSHATEDFWCCVGTGLENHVKYGGNIYFHHQNTLWANLFIPSILNWEEQKTKIKLETNYPEESSMKYTITVDQPKELNIQLRWPAWAASKPLVRVNGEMVEVDGNPSSYISIKREWKDGDILEYELPMSIHTEDLRGDSSKKAILYGPLVLAADLGIKELNPEDIPSFVLNESTLESALEKKEGDDLMFRTVNVTKPSDAVLKPFYQIYKDNYAVYFDFMDEDGWQNKLAQLNAQKAAKEKLEKNTLDIVRIGEMQPERDHNFTGEKTEAGGTTEKWRHATDGGWFSYEMSLSDQNKNIALVCRYFGPDGGNRVFDIMVDNEKIATQQIKKNGQDYYFITYPIPNALLKGKKSIVVKFQAHPGATAGGIFGCRLINENADLDLSLI